MFPQPSTTPSEPHPAPHPAPNRAPDPAPDPGAIQRAEDVQYYRRLLHGLLDVCATVTQRLAARAETPPDTQSDTQSNTGPEITLQIERLARTMRRTIAFARKVTEPPKPRPIDPRPRRRFKARGRILRDVEDVIQRRAETDREARSLRNELRERVDAPDLLEDLDDCSIKDIVTDLMRDLGIAHIPGTHPWARRTPRDIADLNARAADPTFRRPTPPAQASP